MEANTSEAGPSGVSQSSLKATVSESQTQSPGSEQIQNDSDEVTLHRIQELLKTKNDTSRFVGLALLKSVLDNSQQLREDEAVITTLWQSVSPKFLDRLLRSGSKSSSKDAKDMIDIAVAVIHTFAALLPEDVRKSASLVGRIPSLVSVVLHSSLETTQLVLQTLLTLVSTNQGAKVLIDVEDASPLIEIAPSQPLVLDILLYAFSQTSMSAEDHLSLRNKVDQTVQALAVSFKGTDAVTLLSFLDQLLRRLDPETIPPNPKWLKAATSYIRNLVMSKPNQAARAAYTNLTASLLQMYPAEASKWLFSDEAKSDKPFSYLLINLILVDLRSSFPSLLGQLNSVEYESTSRRLASAFDILSAFIGFLIRSLEDEDDDGPLASLMMAPDLLLKLRKSISETLSLAIEYLRDRWDASVAGAMGLHPDARITTTEHAQHALAWDAKNDNHHAAQDPLILAAVRALAFWLREDDNDVLRGEAAGLADLLMDLYKTSSGPAARLDFRRPVLVALEGIMAVDEGVAAVLEHEGWEILTRDMLTILQQPLLTEVDAARGVEIVRVLLPTVEKEHPGSRESWMAMVTAVAAWDVPDAGTQSITVLEFYLAVLQLVTALLENSHPGMQARYVHSVRAVMGIVEQLKGRVFSVGDPMLAEALEDIERTLGPLR